MILNEQVVQKQLVVDKPTKRHVGKARKVVVGILFSQEIKREDENLLRRGSNKRKEDCHLQRMMESS